MSMLKNIKWERFANAVAGGSTQVEAYKSAEFNSKHVASAASKLANRPEVAARIKELTARIEKRSTKAAVQRTSIAKEVVMRELWENLERGRAVRGGSAVVNRACELLGKELGMFQEQPAKPLTLDDLSTDDIKRLLARLTGEEPIQ
jgi:hypothetical protein